MRILGDCLIYVKHPSYKRMYPINGDGGLAMNKIHAATYEKDWGKKVVERLTEANPELKFELRSFEGKKVK